MIHLQSLFHLQQADLSLQTLSLLHGSHTQKFIYLDRCTLTYASKTIIFSATNRSTCCLFSNKSKQNRIKDVRNPKIRQRDWWVNIRGRKSTVGTLYDSGWAMDSLVIYTDPEEEINFRRILHKWSQVICVPNQHQKFLICGKQLQ